MSLELTFLGTGTSHGVPMIACDCPVCLSDNPKNKRTRSSVYIHWDGISILVDAAVELRLQAIRERISRVDAVLFTHAHADHICGLDDLRRFNDIQHQEIPAFGDSHTLQTIQAHFPYIFTPPQPGGGKPRLTLHTVRAGQPFSPLRQLIEQGEHSNHSQKSQIEVLPIELIHGCLRTLGYRFGNLAYLTDVSETPEHSLTLLEGLDVLIVDALRDRPHPTHFSVGQALELVERIRPKRTLFTHISHQLDHEEANSRLPEGVSLAYDEQKISLP